MFVKCWGKFSNMSLLKTFLEIEVDQEGNPLPAEKQVFSILSGGSLEENTE